MDPWSFGSEGKGLLFSDEMDFPCDAFARTRKALMEFDVIPSYSFENDRIVSGEGVENEEFMEFDFTDIMGTFGSEVGSDASKQVSSNCIFTPNSSFGEIECNSHDFSLIDLKLGRLDARNDPEIDFSRERSVLSSGFSKRARTTTSSYYYTPFCQVQGCNMNLGSSKGYHKRHKVCDAHSKTSRVIVNGIEQRFCQQCSRFHLLAEFDDGKRSCRKRLVGHNERRRKPYIDSFSSQSNKYLHSIQGSRFLGDSFPKRPPFVFPDRYREANQCQQIIKFDEVSLAVPKMNRAMLAKSSPRLHIIREQHYVQELTGSSNSSCALSLLSTPISVKTLSSAFSNPIGINQIAPIMHPNTSRASDSGFSYSKQRLAPQQGATVDLMQLSSHLQRVEQHRSYVQIKQENDDLFSFLAT